MPPDPAVVVPLFLLAVAVLVPLSVAAGRAASKARVEADVRRRGGRVTSMRVIHALSRRPGFHVGLVDAGGRFHQVRAYPYWGKVFWRRSDQPLKALDALAGTALDAEWWQTPYSGPSGPLPRQWLPGDSPPTQRKNRMWWLPVVLGAFFLLGSLNFLSAFALVALASGSWLPLLPTAVAAVAGVGLIVLGLRLRR